jgi:hypothetical protein
MWHSGINDCKCEIVIKPINNLNGVLSGITRHNMDDVSTTMTIETIFTTLISYAYSMSLTTSQSLSLRMQYDILHYFYILKIEQLKIVLFCAYTICENCV